MVRRSERTWMHLRNTSSLWYNLPLPIMRQKKHGPGTRAKRSYWKSGLRDYVLADPEPPTSSNYPETIVLPPCVPRSISSLSCLVPRERSTKERVPSWQSYDALIKNYHPPTTKGALAPATRCLLPPLASSPPLPFLSSASFSFSFLADTSFSYLSRPGLSRKAKQATAVELAAEKDAW